MAFEAQIGFRRPECENLLQRPKCVIEGTKLPKTCFRRPKVASEAPIGFRRPKLASEGPKLASEGPNWLQRAQIGFRRPKLPSEAQISDTGWL